MRSGSRRSSRCAESSTLVADYAPDGEGERGSPVEVVRRSLERRGGLRAADVVERAGYPEAPAATVRVVRAGDTVAVVTLPRAAAGGWLVESLTACTGEGLD